MLVAVFGELGSGALGQVAQNTAHVPAFGFIAWLALQWLQGPRALSALDKRDYATAFLVAVTLGILVELLQALLGRDAEVQDVIHDAIGAIATLCIVGAYDAYRAPDRSRMIGYASCAVIALAWGTYPLVWASAAWLKREYQFPVLIEFDSRLDAFFLTANDMQPRIEKIPTALAHENGEKALLMSLTNGTYPGIDAEDLHTDWTGYSTLSFDATNVTARTIELSIRVHDAAHNFTFGDRFTRVYTLPAGTRRVIDIPLAEVESAPKGRKMQMNRIRGVIIFSAGAQPRAAVLLKKLWLH
jgi:hypothetical protein